MVLCIYLLRKDEIEKFFIGMGGGRRGQQRESNDIHGKNAYIVRT